MLYNSQDRTAKMKVPEGSEERAPHSRCSPPTQKRFRIDDKIPLNDKKFICQTTSSESDFPGTNFSACFRGIRASFGIFLHVKMTNAIVPVSYCCLTTRENSLLPCGIVFRTRKNVGNTSKCR